MKSLIVFDLDGTLAQSKSSVDVGMANLLDICGTKFYRYGGTWELLYSEDFTVTERGTIVDALQRAIASANCKVEKLWGEAIEDRGSQITFSTLGQNAPLPDFAKRKKIIAILDTLIPEFSVHIGGAKSVDVTKHGIDKGYGIRKLRDILHIPIDEMIFVRDAVFPGGNDYPAKESGALSIEVKDPHETKRVIEAIVGCLGARR